MAGAVGLRCRTAADAVDAVVVAVVDAVVVAIVDAVVVVPGMSHGGLEESDLGHLPLFYRVLHTRRSVPSFSGWWWCCLKCHWFKHLLDFFLIN